jgi:hypothetical protein
MLAQPLLMRGSDCLFGFWSRRSSQPHRESYKIVPIGHSSSFPSLLATPVEGLPCPHESITVRMSRPDDLSGRLGGHGHPTYLQLLLAQR